MAKARRKPRDSGGAVLRRVDRTVAWADRIFKSLEKKEAAAKKRRAAAAKRRPAIRIPKWRPLTDAELRRDLRRARRRGDKAWTDLILFLLHDRARDRREAKKRARRRPQ